MNLVDIIQRENEILREKDRAWGKEVQKLRKKYKEMKS